MAISCFPRIDGSFSLDVSRCVFKNLACVFHISQYDSSCLFGCDPVADLFSLNPHAVTKSQVIANIDRLLAGKPAEPYNACNPDLTDKNHEIL